MNNAYLFFDFDDDDDDELDDEEYYNTSSEDYDDDEDENDEFSDLDDLDDLDDFNEPYESIYQNKTQNSENSDYIENSDYTEHSDYSEHDYDSDYSSDLDYNLEGLNIQEEDTADFYNPDVDDFEEWYDDFQDAVRQFEQDSLFKSLSSILHQSKNTFAVNRKLMQKAIDVSWVEAIENGLVHVDNFLRNPRRTIEDVEEIVPIALSRKITVESIKHLAQHTDLIQSVDMKTGKITPSKILNVHKEESLLTYENKFVNTLVDRLWLFINVRYEKLAQVSKDEQAYTLGYHTDIDDGEGGKFKMELKLETVSSLEAKNENGYTVWQRVEKLKRIIEGYKGSELCTKLGNTYIRPPVMRTNAIMKNVDLKACLTLWQYIEGYDKAGYEINIEDNVVKPEQDYIEDFYRIALMNLILFRSSMEGQDKAGKLASLKKRKRRTIQPKFTRYFDNQLSDDYTVTVSGAPGYIASDGEQVIQKKLPSDADAAKVFSQIGQVIAIEQAFQADLEKIRLQKEKEAQIEAYRKAEQERIDELRKKELQRIQEQQEREQQELEEMLAQKRAEQEAAERERERQEQERLKLLEERRKQQEEEQKRLEELRKIEEQKRLEEEERQRIADEKSLVRSELGEAEGLDTDNLPEEETPEDIEITEEELESAKESIEENPEESEFEDPREVAVRLKLEQQKREKERAEAERAAKLKADREYFQNKPFSEIYKEYSKNPIYAIPRFVRWLLVVLFHLIPENTDNPDWKRLLAQITAQKEEKEREKQEKEKMEVYYRKYAQTFKYKFRRSIEDYKFKKKREKQRKNQPRKPYVPPKRTHEEELFIQKQMKSLYREYHVTPLERLIRWWKEFQRSRKTM